MKLYTYENINFKRVQSDKLFKACRSQKLLLLLLQIIRITIQMTLQLKSILVCVLLSSAQSKHIHRQVPVKSDL